MSERKADEFPVGEVLGPVGKKEMVYKRVVSGPRLEVETQIGERYGKGRGFIFPSGLSAIMLTLKAALGIHRFESVILHGNELYCDTPNKIFRQLTFEHPGVETIPFDVTNRTAFRDGVRRAGRRPGILLVESASNPSGQMFNWEWLRELPKGWLVVVDNTWLTSALFNPFEVGASFVVESASKYNSAGEAIAGLAVAASKGLTDVLQRLLQPYGVHVPESTCRVVSEALVTLDERMAELHRRTEPVATELSKVTDVLYPTLDSHPTIGLYRKYIRPGGPGVFIFFCPGKITNRQLGTVCVRQRIFYATSFGKTVSLIDMWPKRTKDGLWIRVSVGSEEEPGELIKRLLGLYAELTG